MKKTVKNLVVSVALIAALLVAVSVEAKDAAITASTGTVQLLTKNGAWQKAGLNKVLKAGTTVRTVGASTATVRLPDIDGFAVLGSGSVLTLNESSVKNGISDTTVSLAAGQFASVIKSFPQGSVLNVKTPQRTIVIREPGSFVVNADGSVSVLEGKVMVGDAVIGANQTLAAGADAPTALDAAAQASLTAAIAAANTPASANKSSKVAKKDSGDSEDNSRSTLASSNIVLAPIDILDAIDKAHRAAWPMTATNKVSPDGSQQNPGEPEIPGGDDNPGMYHPTDPTTPSNPTGSGDDNPGMWH